MTLSTGKAAIGIFGGTFNPVHLGHVKLAEMIQRECHFKPLWIVPNRFPPHKNDVEFSGEARLAMAKLALSHVQNVQFSSFELESDGPSYAIRTIEHFRRQHLDHPLFFILGEDAFHDLPHWYAFPDVMEACNYLIVTRAGWDEQSENESRTAKRVEKLIQANLLLPEQPVAPFEKMFRTRSGTHVCFLPGRLPEVSSTEIRLRLQMGESIKGLVPEQVERYLLENRRT